MQRVFEKAPSLELYERLRKLAGAAARDRAIEFLKAQLPREAPTRWHSPSDLLISILMHEKMQDAAWAIVRDHGASMGLKMTLARACEATHPSKTLETYVERVEELANTGGDHAYAEAAQLVARLAGLQSATEHSTYVAALKARFARRRNFMKLLS